MQIKKQQENAETSTGWVEGHMAPRQQYFQGNISLICFILGNVHTTQESDNGNWIPYLK